MVSHEKSGQSDSQLTCKSIFLLDNHYISVFNWSALGIFPFASYRVLIKKGCTQRLRVKKLIIFISSSRIFKRETDLFFSVSAWWWRMQDSVEFSAFLIVLRHQPFYPSSCFCIISANVNTVKKPNIALKLLWKQFWPHSPPPPPPKGL